MTSPNPVRRFADRVAIVTGAASGIGLHTAAVLLGQGATVEIADINTPRPTSVADSGIDLDHSRLTINDVDVTSDDRVRRFVDDVRARRGRIDVVVNNAIRRPANGIETMTIDAWTMDIDIGLTAPFLMIRATLPALVANGGSIVNVASINARRALGCEAYSAAKAGLISLTRNVAARYGVHGVRANAVLPGTIATELWNERFDADPQLRSRLGSQYPLGRIGTPHDVATAICFLASDDAAWITGAELVVDGGFLAAGGDLTHILRPQANTR